jgi:hypothetical protein
MNALPKEPRVWLLIDNRVGNKSQVLGVAEALGLPYEIKPIAYNSMAVLHNTLLGASFRMLTPTTRSHLCKPWPDIVIAAGRRTAPAARQIKRLSGGKTFLVQIMYPGSRGEGDFSLIAVPSHDGLPKAANRFEITGAPHSVTAKALDEAKRFWAPKFEHLPKPRVALIVGGSTKSVTFSPQMASQLGQQAAAFVRSVGGSLLVTTSRRSTAEATQALLSAIEGVPAHLFTWGDTGDNPYMGYLALADHIIVTGDSVSMCSEACATSRPVYIFTPKGLITPKHARLHAQLYAKGYAEPLDQRDSLDEWTHPPLNAATDIAAEIKKRLGEMP